MESEYKIFAKKEQTENTNNYEERMILPKNEILSSIPKDATNQEDKNLALSKVELRWRIFKIPNIENEIVEISQKPPNSERLYMSQKSKWRKYNDDGKYDKYIIKQYYYYQ
jgi:hypothetical protein